VVRWAAEPRKHPAAEPTTAETVGGHADSPAAKHQAAEAYSLTVLSLRVLKARASPLSSSLGYSLHPDPSFNDMSTSPSTCHQQVCQRRRPWLYARYERDGVYEPMTPPGCEAGFVNDTIPKPTTWSNLLHFEVTTMPVKTLSFPIPRDYKRKQDHPSRKDQ